MKKSIVLILLIFTIGFASAEKFSKGKIIFNDGKFKTGFIESSWSRTILFKSSESAQPEKIKADDLKTVVYIKDDGTTDELDRIRRYGLFNKLTDYEWLHVSERGAVTIYVIGVTMGANTTRKANFVDYYAIREGEPGAKMIASVSGGNPNSVFRNKASIYFAD